MAAAVVLVASFLSGPSFAQAPVDTDADAILRKMTERLGAMPSFGAAYETDHEIIDRAGRKIQYSASGSIQVARGKGLHMTRMGPFANAEMTFDGKVVSIYGKDINAYVQIESPGPTLDEAAEEVRMSTGLDLPAADLLSPKAYEYLVEGVTEGVLVGRAYVGGVECDHLAFRTDDVDWQIWVSKDGALPMKYVITSKWLTGAPQYSLRLSNWTSGTVEPKLLSFSPPAGAKKLEQIYSDQIGEIFLQEVK